MLNVNLNNQGWKYKKNNNKKTFTQKTIEIFEQHTNHTLWVVSFKPYIVSGVFLFGEKHMKKIQFYFFVLKKLLLFCFNFFLKSLPTQFCYLYYYICVQTQENKRRRYVSMVLKHRTCVLCFLYHSFYNRKKYTKLTTTDIFLYFFVFC